MTSSHKEVPRASARPMLRQLFSFGGGRVDMLTGLQAHHRDYGSVVRQPGPLRMFSLFGPDANRLVLLDRERIFSAERPWTQIMGRIFSHGLLLKDGEEHKHHRKIMHVAFKQPSLLEYLDRMNPMIEAALQGWSNGSERFLAFPAFKSLTLDMAAAVFVGVDLGDTRRMNGAFEDMVAASMSRIRLRIPGLEFYRGLRGREFMIDYLRDLIDKKRSSDGPDMFTRLCHAATEEGDRFQDQEIIDHMVFLMMAAHDTTTSTLSSMTYELARDQAWQDRIRQECRQLGRDHVTFDDVENGLPLLGQVMRETLRRYPPLPVIPRISTADFEFDGYLIPAKSLLVVAPIHTHHMEEWWSEPKRFDPDRFSPGRAEQDRHTHSWIPFGGGPHHCLGLRFAETQVKAVMHQLVQRYRWTVPDGYEMPVQQAPISKPRDGLPISLEPL